MAYVCELNPGHHVYLDNQGDQTTVITTMGMPGQQQQASSSMTTGPWIAPPEGYQNTVGTIVKLFTAQGEIYVYIQGNSITLTGSEVSMVGAQQLSMRQTVAMPTLSMPPMQPMTMGTMQMTMNPMEMHMGNMELKMNAVNQAPQPTATRQFCSQCGAKVAPEDNFCSSCGHALS